MTAEILKPQVGDVVHVRGEVRHTDDLGFALMIPMMRPTEKMTIHGVDPSAIVHIEPRPLKVGDRVRVISETPKAFAYLLALDGEVAWVRYDDRVGHHAAYHLNNLVRA